MSLKCNFVPDLNKRLKKKRFTHGEAQSLHFGCADPCEFLKCGNLDCIICGSGGLRSRSPLILMLKIICAVV